MPSGGQCHAVLSDQICVKGKAMDASVALKPTHMSRPKAQGSDIAIRCLDVAIASVALAFFSPLLLLIVIATYVSDPGPIFFGHSRIGKGGCTFKCLKFRSMVVNAEARLSAILASDAKAREAWERDHKLTHDPRITRFGRFMRVSSLDELPQLWNVIRGDMSLVGPRPIVIGELPRYGRYIESYFSMRPGITGLWQVSGRNDVSYRRRVAFDVTFARRRSVAIYFKILILTIPAVLAQRGSY